MNHYTSVDITKLIVELNNNLPKNIPMNFSRNVDLARIAILRESIFLRFKELVESSFDACLKNRLVSAIILYRSLMETEALFMYFFKEIEQIVKNNNYDEIKEFLTKSLVGARSAMATKKFNRPLAVNILTYIDYMDNQIPNYRTQYEFLSEFSHPNSAGLNNIYSKFNSKNKKMVFTDNHEKINIEFIYNHLGVSLELFIMKYNSMAILLNELLVRES